MASLHESTDVASISWWRLAIAAVCSCALAGCDAGFASQIEVTYASASVSSVGPALDAKVISALRAYSASQGHSCSETSELPLRCAWQPINIIAFRTPTGAMVCYGALGIPLESGKFNRRIEQLTQFLGQQEGLSVSASPVSPVMPRTCVDWFKTHRPQ
jgi:hypothetical protein